MKLVIFNSTRLGVVTNGNVVDVTDTIQNLHHVTTQDLVNGVIAGFNSLKGKLEDAASSSQGVPLESVALSPPLPRRARS